MKLPSFQVNKVKYWESQMVQPIMRWGHLFPPAFLSKQEEEGTPTLANPTTPHPYIPESLNPRDELEELSMGKERQ